MSSYIFVPHFLQNLALGEMGLAQFGQVALSAPVICGAGGSDSAGCGAPQFLQNFPVLACPHTGQALTPAAGRWAARASGGGACAGMGCDTGALGAGALATWALSVGMLGAGALATGTLCAGIAANGGSSTGVSIPPMNTAASAVLRLDSIEGSEKSTQNRWSAPRISAALWYWKCPAK